MRACPRELVRESPFARARAQLLGSRETSARALRKPFARAPLREPLQVGRGWVVGGLRVEGASARACPREPVRESLLARACAREPVRERPLGEPSERALCESPSARASPREPLRVDRWWVAGGSQGSESLSARALPREPLRVGRGWVAGEREQEEQQEQQQLFRSAQPPTNALRDFLLRSGTPSL